MSKTETYVGKVLVGKTKFTIDTPSKSAVRAFFQNMMYENSRRILTLYDRYDMAIVEYRDVQVLGYFGLEA